MNVRQTASSIPALFLLLVLRFRLLGPGRARGRRGGGAGGRRRCDDEHTHVVRDEHGARNDNEDDDGHGLMIAMFTIINLT